MPNDFLFNYFNEVYSSKNSEGLYEKYIGSDFGEYNKKVSEAIVQTDTMREAQKQADLQRNFNVNSIKSLVLSAGGTEEEANDFYNQIGNLQTGEQYRGLYNQLKEYKEKATDNKYLFDLAEYGESLYQGIKTMVSSGEENKRTNLKSLLRQNKVDINQISAVSTPSELFDYASNVLAQKQYVEDARKINTQKLTNQISSFQNITTDQNYFNSYLEDILKKKLTTPGNDYYREVDPEAQKRAENFGGTFIDGSQDFIDDYQKELLKKVNSSAQSKADRYFKYDLEKEFLGQSKYALSQALSQVNDKIDEIDVKNQKDLDNPELKALLKQKQNYLTSLKKLSAREANLQKLYGVEKGDRSGGFRALVGAMWQGYENSLGNVKPSGDKVARGQLQKAAFYTPEVIQYDKYGNAILSTDFLVRGDLGYDYNWSGLLESGLKLTGEMLPIITNGQMVGNAIMTASNLGSKSAKALSKSYQRINNIKVPVLGKLRLSDRISTMGSVAANTYPIMLEEEIKWGGDYQGRARALAINEGITEALGFPEIGGLRVKGYTRNLRGSTRTAANIPLNRATRLVNYARGGVDLIKNVGKLNLLESFEEEMALLGEYLISNHIYDDEYDVLKRDKTEFNTDTFIETLQESFKAGLVYSGLNAGMRHRAITSRDHLQNVANYEAANNPELFRAQLKQEYDEGKITQDQFNSGIRRIEELKATFESIPSLNNIGTLQNFLDDDDARFRLFSLAVERNDLLEIDLENLNDEQREELNRYKTISNAQERAKERYDQIKVRLAELTTKAETEELTPEEKQEVLNLTLLSSELGNLKRARISATELDASTLEMLRENNLIVNSDEEFTQEDLDDIIANIETDIIETEKRTERFANMSEQEKNDFIDNLYNEKIKAIEEESDPETIAQSYSNIKRDIEELEKLNDKSNEKVLERKRELFETYGERFENLTGKKIDERTKKPVPGSTSAFEDELSSIDIQKLAEANDIKSLIDLLGRIQYNKNHINESLFAILEENINLSLADVINNINNAQGNERIELLNQAFNSLIKLDRGVYFNIDQLNEYLKLSDNVFTEVTPEEFETLKNNYIAKRGLERSRSLSQTGSYDSSDTADVTGQDERDDLTDLARDSQNADTTVDESGNSQKRDTELEYYNRITSNKSPQEIAQVLRNRINVYFNSRSARAKKLQGILNNYLANKDKEQFIRDLNEVREGILNEINSLSATNPNSGRIDMLRDALAEMGLWEKTANRLVRENPKLDFGTSANQNVGDNTGKTDDLSQDDSTQQDDEPTTKPASSEKIPEVIKSGLEKLDALDQQRKNRLLDLTSPARTAAIEVSEDNKVNQDSAVQRRVRFINELPNEDFKAKVLNRRQFLREFLTAKFPEKSYEEIEEDLVTISNFFKNNTTSLTEFNAFEEAQFIEFMTPINELLGENFFDIGQIKYFLVNKGQGLIENPDVVVTAARPDGDLILKEGFPLELNFVGNQTAQGKKSSSWKNISWRNSRRVEKAATELGVTEGLVIRQHIDTLKSRDELVNYLKQNDDSDVLIDAEVSEGVLLAPNNYTDIENLPEESAKLSIDDFQIATSAAQPLFDQYFKFELGRLYYNNNGNPTLLNNRQITLEEATAIAEVVFSNRTDLISSNELDDYLRSIINQIDKKNRLMFFPGDTYTKITDDGSTTEIDQLIKPKIATMGRNGKYQFKELTKEEFIQTLTNHYYKVDNDYLPGGRRQSNTLPYFAITEQGIQVGRENYLDYIKRTHLFPVNSENKITSLVNKSVYLDNESIGKINKAKNVTPTSTPSTTPTSKDTKDTKDTEDTDTKPTLSRKIDDVFGVVEFEDVSSFLGASPRVKAGIYQEAIDQIVTNPNSIESISILVPEGDGYRASLYEESSPQVKYELALALVKVGDKTVKVLLSKTQLSEDGTVLGVTRPAPKTTDAPTVKALKKEEWSKPTKPAPKLSFDQGNALADDTDQSQKQDAKDKKDTCKNAPVSSMKKGRKPKPKL